MGYSLVRNHCFRFCFWLRLASKPNALQWFGRCMYRICGARYGICIPRGTQIGKGLYLGHGIGVIVNPTAVIGNNCNISQFVTIGSNEGKAAVIGDNVYIGPSVCIVENVRIGDNVTIGAGAVVTRDVPDNATVAGVPARVISYKEPARFIKNKWTGNE